MTTPGRERQRRAAKAGASPGGVENPRLVGEHDRLDAVAEVELLEDVRDVGLDRGVADVELLRDLQVGEAVCDQAEDFQFARGQLVELLGGCGARDARELLDHAFGDRR
jgi:hypothetical protein